MAGDDVLGLTACVKDSFPDRRPALVGWLPHGSACIDRYLLVLCAGIILCAGLMAYAGCRTLGLLYSRLLDEGLRLMVQVACLGIRWFGHRS
jgi:hypothetical protein